MFNLQSSRHQKRGDKEGLAEKKGFPNLYVGESARSVAERAAEHWRDAESGKEDSHMLEHQGGGASTVQLQGCQELQDQPRAPSKGGCEDPYEGGCVEQERDV